MRNTFDLKVRTKAFAMSIIRLYTSLPRSTVAQVIGNQVLRSGTSVGANYREGCRARSKQEFAAKLGICLQELDETSYWIELLLESGIVTDGVISGIAKECDELTAIIDASISTVKRR